MATSKKDIDITTDPYFDPNQNIDITTDPYFADTQSPQSTVVTSTPNPNIPDQEFEMDDLDSKKDWLQQARIIHDYENPDKKFEGSNKELSDWFKDRHSSVAHNLTNLIMTGVDTTNMSDEVKKAWAQSLDTYDKTDSDFSSFARAVGNTFADPLTYPGIVGTAGLGLIAKFGAKGAAKVGLRELLGRFEFKHQLNKQIASGISKKGAEEFAKTGASKEVTKEVLEKARKEAAKSVGKAQKFTGAAAGAGWGGGFTAGREALEVGIDKKEDIDPLTIGFGAGAGLVAGGLAGRYLPTVIEKLGRSRALGKIADETVPAVQQKSIDENGILKTSDDSSFMKNVEERAFFNAKELELNGEVTINIPEGNLTRNQINKIIDIYNSEGIEVRPVGNSKNQFIGRKIVEQESRSADIPEGRNVREKLFAKFKSTFYDDRGLGDAFKAASRKKTDGIRYNERVIQQSWKSLEKAILKNYGIKSFKDLDDNQLAIMNEAFKGSQQALKTLNARGAKDVVKELQQMRTNIQALQKELLDENIIDKTSEEGKELIGKINKSMDGTDGELYVTRRYESFDNPNWKTDLTKRDGGQAIINDATNYIYKLEKASYRNWAREQNNLLKKEYAINEKNYIDGLTEEMPVQPRHISEIPNKERQQELWDRSIRSVDEILSTKNLADSLNALDTRAYQATNKASKILTRRQNIDERIRLLMGEYNDPFTNYANTLKSLFQTIHTYKYEDEISKLIQAGGLKGKVARYKKGTAEMNVPLTSRLPENIGEQTGLKERITALQKKGLDEKEYLEKLDEILNKEPGIVRPLRGFEAYPEVAEAIQMGNELMPVTQAAIRKYLTFQGYTRAGKTVYSPSAIARNYLGSGMMSLGAGYLNPRKMKAHLDVFKGLAIKGPEADEELEKVMVRGLALGHIQSGTEFNALKGALADAGNKDFFNFQSPLYRSRDQAVKTAKKYNTKAVNFYQAMDDVWKEFAFRNEKDMQRQTLIDRLPVGESPDDVVRILRTAKGTEVPITKLDEFAGKFVGDHMQNYANVPIFVKHFRRWPLADFLAFKTEMARTTKNIIRNAYRDMRDGKELMAKKEPSLDINGKPTGLLKGQHQRNQGRKRLMSAVATIGSVPAIATTSAYMMGMNDEVKDTGYTKSEGLERILSSEWSKGHNYLYFGDPQKGKGRRLNLSYINPWAAGMDMITAAARALDTGENVDNAISNASIDGIWKPLKDTFGPSMLAEAVWNIINNENEFGQEIYDRKANSSLDWAQQAMEQGWNAFQPGGVKTIRDIYMAATSPKTKKDLFGKEGIDPEPWAITKYGVSSGKVGTKKYLQDQITSLAGIKPEAYDINAIFPLKLKSLERKRRDTITKFKTVYQDRQVRTPEELVDAYKDSIESNYSYAKDAYDLGQQYKAAASYERNGKIRTPTGNQMINAITKSGLFKERLDRKLLVQMLKGRFIPPQPNIRDIILWSEDTKKLTGVQSPRKELNKAYREIYSIWGSYMKKKTGE